jgi:hypothetical protein
METNMRTKALILLTLFMGTSAYALPSPIFNGSKTYFPERYHCRAVLASPSKMENRVVKSLGTITAVDIEKNSDWIPFHVDSKDTGDTYDMKLALNYIKLQQGDQPPIKNMMGDDNVYMQISIANDKDTLYASTLGVYGQKYLTVELAGSFVDGRSFTGEKMVIDCLKGAK